jgi:hypothetical protein
MKISPLASKVATQYMLRRAAGMGGPPEEGAPPAATAQMENTNETDNSKTTSMQDQTAMPKSPVGQQMLHEALDKLQEAFDNLDDEAFQKQLDVCRKLSVPGQGK